MCIIPCKCTNQSINKITEFYAHCCNLSMDVSSSTKCISAKHCGWYISRWHSSSVQFLRQLEWPLWWRRGIPWRQVLKGKQARARWTTNEMQPVWKQTWKQGALCGLCAGQATCIFPFKWLSTILKFGTFIHDTHQMPVALICSNGLLPVEENKKTISICKQCKFECIKLHCKLKYIQLSIFLSLKDAQNALWWDVFNVHKYVCL